MKRSFLIIFIVVWIGLAVAHSSMKASVPNDWPMFGHDPEHTGFTEVYMHDDLKILWKKKIWMFSSPAVVDCKVYVAGTKNGYEEPLILCLNAYSGETLWEYQIEDTPLTVPAVVNNRVYVSSFDGQVYCLDATTGEFKWKYKTFDITISSPTLDWS